ncbi:uncharacterized protein LOC116805693 isoform X2 [Drosophila grimshawi]|nr:uncharacterized protein LOC116805693 isoform X2 [Drosophila grimshawi]
MEHLLKTGHLSDCSFVVYDDDGNKTLLKCHKFVLMSVSPVFERMFAGDFEEANIPENIVLDDVLGHDFKKFLDYLYLNDNERLESYDLRTLQTLIYLSKKFMVSSLTTNCFYVIKRRLATGLDVNLTIDLFEYSHQIENEDLINSIKKKFRSNPLSYIDTAAVYDLTSDVFLKFMENLITCVADKLRLSVIDRYCKMHGLLDSTLAEDQSEDCLKPNDRALETNENKKKEDMCKNYENGSNVYEEKDTSVKQMDNNQYIYRLLKTIKFTSMSSYDFCAGPGESNLLTVEKKYELLSSICIAEYKMKLFANAKY